MTKNTRKRLCSLIAVSAYIIGAAVFPAASADTYNELFAFNSVSATEKQTSVKTESFTDISKNDWYYKYVDSLVSRGIITGTSQSTYSPSGTFSVAECCAVITRYLGLEADAAERKARLIKAGCKGSSEWYAGYIQLMYEAGVLDINGIAVPDKNGLLSISDGALRPIKRYEFADCVSKSFELSGNVKAKNVYGELGGFGNEFICSGAYDMDVVYAYSDLIKDFEAIPELSRVNVLKAYYNGIFNGDVTGNFYPDEKLTRAEMSKVIAAVTDYSLRTRKELDNSNAFVTNESSFITDASGEKYIKQSYAEKILLSEADGITVNNGDILYNRAYSAPMGYAIDVYVYTSHGTGGTRLGAKSTLADGNPNEKKTVFYWFGSAGKALLVLRNLSEGSRPEAVLEITLNKASKDSHDFCTREPSKIQ